MTVTVNGNEYHKLPDNERYAVSPRGEVLVWNNGTYRPKSVHISARGYRSVTIITRRGERKTVGLARLTYMALHGLTLAETAGRVYTWNKNREPVCVEHTDHLRSIRAKARASRLPDPAGHLATLRANLDAYGKLTATGDRGPLHAIAERYRPDVERVLRRHTLIAHKVRDLTNDTFAAFWIHVLSGNKVYADIRAALVKIAVSLWRQEVKRER